MKIPVLGPIQCWKLSNDITASAAKNCFWTIFASTKPSQSFGWGLNQVKHLREVWFHKFRYISTAYFCSSY